MESVFLKEDFPEETGRELIETVIGLFRQQHFSVVCSGCDSHRTEFGMARASDIVDGIPYHIYAPWIKGTPIFLFGPFECQFGQQVPVFKVAAECS